MAPLVLVTCDRRDLGPSHGAANRIRPARPEVFVGENVVMCLTRAGARVVLVPPGQDAVPLLDLVDGVVITGGAFDIHPRHYGAAVIARLDRVEEGRTETELGLAAECAARDIPLLGICGGMQAMVVALGGSLVQHVDHHEQPTDPEMPWHPLVHSHPLLPHSANSTHHQAVENPGTLVVIARAPDGVVEAVEAPGARFLLGVQWHPELTDGLIFPAFIAAATRYRADRRLWKCD